MYKHILLGEICVYSPQLTDPFKGIGIIDFLLNHGGNHITCMHLYHNEGRQCHAANLGNVMPYQGSQIVQLFQKHLIPLCDSNSNGLKT